MNTPPLLAELILAELAGDRDSRDSVLGDLAEEHHAKCSEAGPAAAARWYWTEALASVPPLAGAALRRAPAAAWIRTVAAVAVSFAALVALLIVTNAGLRRLIDAVGSVSESWWRSLASLAMAAACSVVAGWIAGAVGRRAPFASAVALGMTCLGLNLQALVRGTAEGPRWYWVTFGLTAFSGIIVGGLLRLRQGASRGR